MYSLLVFGQQSAKILHLLGASSVSESIVTHVLEYHFTVVVLVCAGVLVGPLDGQDGAFIVVETAYVVASTVIV